MKEKKDFREVLYTIDEEGKRNWVYSALAAGRFFHRRRFVAYILMTIYLVTPWLTIGGKQAVFLNIPQREFTFYGTTFFATDTFYLMLTLGILGLTLFFFTALFGRIWCGWACPETVFLEFLFRPIERLIEGTPQSRRKLDASGWSGNKIVRKATKYLLFLVAAGILANTALAYLFGAHRMLDMVTHSPSQNLGPFLATLAMMSILLFQFGWFREQFCTILCPYARFQSVLMDSDSLVIGYDTMRGEPRGKLKTTGDEVRGDCVDCGACVRACPTGIDIRNGLQLECVNCAACIDACDAVMDNVGYRRGLIRYDTENRLCGKQSRILRPRVVVYAATISLFFAVFAGALVKRVPFEVDFMRAPGVAPFSKLPDGRLSNHLNVQFANKSDVTKQFQIGLSGNSQHSIEVVVPGDTLTLQPHELKRIPLFVNFPAQSTTSGKLAIVFEVESEGLKTERPFMLLGPEE